ncbi:MAG: hypothetical protein CVV49_00395 [Spirochaetae bacterium HGW-Spirochaetae-5]|nr:MAG: hypothetical protein CVV49_00395 [Spirochaetae bacterium HGW-Spirochaetae-5]
MKPFFTPEPVIFFNSPASKKYPGNTILAMEEAFSEGADVVCLNIQFSKDKTVMAISEPAVDNLCEGSGPVSGFTLAELKHFDAGYSFADDKGDFPFRGKELRFQTLEEVLKTFPDKRFNIAIMDKDPELVKSYVSIIKNLSAGDRVLTSTMYGGNIKLVRKLLPGSATAFTLTGIIGVYALFKSGILYFVRGFKADALQTPEAIGVSYIANAGLIGQVQSKDVRVHVWYVKDRTQLKRVYESGADGFIVDDVAMVKEFLAER